MKRIKLIITLIITISIIIIGYYAYVWLFKASDHTKLSGIITVDKTNIKIGETVTLMLTVPDKLDAIHRLHWEVRPATAGEIIYTQIEYEAGEKNRDGVISYPKDDRTARFTARQTGTCTITVVGFFKQTNPQPVASLELVIQNE